MARQHLDSGFIMAVCYMHVVSHRNTGTCRHSQPFLLPTLLLQSTVTSCGCSKSTFKTATVFSRTYADAPRPSTYPPGSLLTSCFPFLVLSLLNLLSPPPLLSHIYLYVSYMMVNLYLAVCLPPALNYFRPHFFPCTLPKSMPPKQSVRPLTLMSREEVGSCVNAADRAKLSLQVRRGHQHYLFRAFFVLFLGLPPPSINCRRGFRLAGRCVSPPRRTFFAEDSISKVPDLQHHDPCIMLLLQIAINARRSAAHSAAFHSHGGNSLEKEARMLVAHLRRVCSRNDLQGLQIERQLWSQSSIWFSIIFPATYESMS